MTAQEQSAVRVDPGRIEFRPYKGNCPCCYAEHERGELDRYRDAGVEEPYLMGIAHAALEALGRTFAPCTGGEWKLCTNHRRRETRAAGARGASRRAGYIYTCEGKQDGTCGLVHRKFAAALECCGRRLRATKRAGGPLSDRAPAHTDGTPLTPDEARKLREWESSPW